MVKRSCEKITILLYLIRSISHFINIISLDNVLLNKEDFQLQKRYKQLLVDPGF